MRIPVQEGSPVRREPRTDAPGVVGLIFGCIAVACVPLACLTHVISLIGSILFSIIGMALSATGRGNLRVAGLTLNLLVFIPALVLFILVMAGAIVNARHLR
jgi:hypothetical protein